MKDPDLEPIKVVSHAARVWDELVATDTLDAEAISVFEEMAATVAEGYGDLDASASVTWVAGMLAALALVDQCRDEDPMAGSLDMARATTCAITGQDTIIAVYGPITVVQLAVGCLSSSLLVGKL